MWTFRISSAALLPLWAARDPEAFLALWHPDGILRRRSHDRPVTGKELGRLTELARETAPDHVWQLLDWTARGDVVIVEWQATRTPAASGSTGAASTVPPARRAIAEETVYLDTAALRAMRRAAWPEPLSGCSRDAERLQEVESTSRVAYHHEIISLPRRRRCTAGESERHEPS